MSRDLVGAVCERDHQDDRRELALVEVVCRRVPDLVGDRVRAVGQPGRSLGQFERGALLAGEVRRLSPADQVVQPLIGLAGRSARLGVSAPASGRGRRQQLAGENVFQPLLVPLGRPASVTDEQPVDLGGHERVDDVGGVALAQAWP